MSKTMTPAEIESYLAGFYGTENYYKYMFGVILTDGAKAMAEACEAFWLLDAIASHQPVARKACDGMQFWKFKKHATGGGVLTCVKDSGMDPCVTQEIEFTDFPLDEIDIWVGEDPRGPVIMLKSEY